MEETTSALPVIPGDQIAQLRAFLAQLAEDADHLADVSADDEADAALERLADAGETLATMAGPLALTRGDLPRLHAEVEEVLRQIAAIRDAARWEPYQQASRHSAVDGALEQMEDTVQHLAELALSGTPSLPRPSHRGTARVIPVLVVALVSLLMLGLLLTIRFAPHGTSTVAHGGHPDATATPGHHVSTTPTMGAHKTPGATPTSSAATGTPVAGAPSPTPGTTSVPGATPTPGTAGPTTLTVAPTAIAPCVDTPDTFTLTASNGPTALKWTAVYDASQVHLDQTHGSLQPGHSSTISVLALNTNAVGQIQITATGLPTQSVSYDATGC